MPGTPIFAAHRIRKAKDLADHCPHRTEGNLIAARSVSASLMMHSN